MTNLKSHFLFTKKQRNGIFLLISIIVVLQLAYFFIDISPKETFYDHAKYEKLIREIDSLRRLTLLEKRPKIEPFNPNYITDFKGASLGMSNEEIDRLLAYRKQNRWINSVADFQKVTQVSDSMLNVLSPHFRFPDWIESSKSKTISDYKVTTASIRGVEKRDLNKATPEELQEVNGVGNVLSKRIVKFRNTFDGGFIADIQLEDVYGLNMEAIQNITDKFTVKSPRIIQKINLNEASLNQLIAIQHINYNLASNIIEARILRGDFQTLDELTKVKGFPANKLEIIKLYLTLEKEN